jgi:hypothetical protein
MIRRMKHQNEVAPAEVDREPTLIELAIQNQASPDALAALAELQWKHEERQAQRAFVKALAAFKAEAPKIRKTKSVRFGNTAYEHAELSDIVAILNPALAEHGLSFTWDTKNEAGRVTVSCVLSHVDGHRERTTLSGPEDQSGGKNAIQAVGSSTTYLQRYTLLSALGLASGDDDDGRGGPGNVAASPVSTEQLGILEDWIQKFETDVPALLETVSARAGFEVDAPSKIPAALFDKVVEVFKRKEAEQR